MRINLKKNLPTRTGIALALLLSLTPEIGRAATGETSSIDKALATIAPTQNNSARGTVVYSSTDKGIKISAKISGLSPGKHGFHIHEFGDCSAPDGTSAGGHFAPGHAKHGAPDAEEHHTGDMGNIVADNDGNASLELLSDDMSFEGKNSIIGRAVIVHSKADSFDQPSGSAGARVACGVIGVSKPG